MVAPPKNECLPTNVFGGFNQHLFLGCSVIGFTASAGWNGQQSEITIHLAEDTCAAPAGTFKRYYDSLVQPQEWTDADPGFYGITNEIIGCPAYFRVEDFEYSGIIQSWEEVHSGSENPGYIVKMVDPSGLLSQSQLIINEYAGNVLELPNIFNIFGYLESFGASCLQRYQVTPGVYFTGDGGPDGAIFGSPAQAFGGANANFNGLQWNQMLSGMIISISNKDLSGLPVTTPWSPHGRIVFRGPGTSPAEHMGLLSSGAETVYYVDLDEMPTAPSYWRFNGLNVTIMDAVSQICQDAVYDYAIQLVPVEDADNPLTEVDLFIKVRTVDRENEPTAGTIDTFINDPANEEKIIDYKKGKELRNEFTESFVLGGRKQTFYQAEQHLDPEADGQPSPPELDDVIIPYVGLNPDGNVIVPYKDNQDYWIFPLPTSELALQLHGETYGAVNIPQMIEIHEIELMMSLASYDGWSSFASTFQTDLWQALDLGDDFRGVMDMRTLIELNNKGLDFTQNQTRGADWVATLKDQFPKHFADPNEFALAVAQSAYSWLNKVAEEHYGKTYQVRVPWVCHKFDTESGRVISGEEPSDGGWTQVAPVLGLETLYLSNPDGTPVVADYTKYAIDFFTLEDKRLGAFCRFDDPQNYGVDIASLNVNDYVMFPIVESSFPFPAPPPISNKLWVKLGVDDQFVFVNKTNFFSPRVVVNLPQRISQAGSGPFDESATELNWGLQKLITHFAHNFDGGGGGFTGLNEAQALAIVQGVFARVGSSDLHEEIVSRPIMPNACGFGIKSHVLRYGPWGQYGAAGQVKVVEDEGLVPWEYGNVSVLNLAGDSKAIDGVSDQQVNEEGSITRAGYPVAPLLGELLQTNTGVQLFENRSETIFMEEGIRCARVDMGALDGTYGPIITGVTTYVDPNGLKTTYTMRTWTPTYGKFQRDNAERLRQWGQANADFQKNMRSWYAHRVKLSKVAFINQLYRMKEARKALMMRSSRQGAGAKTPSEVIVSQHLDWGDGDFRRSPTAIIPIHEVGVEIAEDYDVKAFMSLDGLIRPVSIAGDGGLPQYATPKGNCQITSHRGAQPPVDKNGEAGNLDQYNLDIDINYLDPFSNPGGNVAGRSDVDHGHDIELLGRGSTPPPSSMMLPIQGGLDTGDSKESDYAEDYRMLCLKGPLLMQGWAYDLDGFPVPNAADTEPNAELGIFTDTNLEHKFLDEFMRKPHTWPVGPIDLRWDRERAVWTFPEYRDLEVELEEDVDCDGSGIAKIIAGPILYDSGGIEMTDAQVMVKNIVGSSPLKSGTKAIVRFDRFDCVYKIIESKVAINGIDVDCCVPYGNRVQGTSIPFSKIAFAYGLRMYNTGCDAAGTSDPTDCDFSTHRPEAILSAGIAIQAGTGGGTPGDVDFANSLTFGPGFSIAEGDDECEAIITIEGPCITGSDDCIVSPSPLLECYSFDSLNLSRGLRFVVNGGEVKVGAGMKYENSETAVTVPATVDFANTITLGKNLAAQDDGGCGVLISFTGGAGEVCVATSDDCYTDGSGPCDDVSNLTFGRGLNVEIDGDTAKINSYITVDGDKATGLTFSGNCFNITAPATDCDPATVELNMTLVTLVVDVLETTVDGDHGIYKKTIEAYVCSPSTETTTPVILFTEC